MADTPAEQPTTPVSLQPAEIREWEDEDLIESVQAEATALGLAVASEDETKAMLEEVRLALPSQIEGTELTDWAAARNTPLSLPIPGDRERFRFFLAEVPVHILVPEAQRLHRLRLKLDFSTGAAAESEPVAYDLFPPDKWEVKETEVGEVGVDVSKALTFVVGKQVSDCLGFKLKLPLRWKSESLQIATSDRMSNPLEWYIRDRSIQHGFTGYVIIRAPKSTPLTVGATLGCEVRKSGPLGHIFKKRFVSDRRTYTLA